MPNTSLLAPLDSKIQKAIYLCMVFSRIVSKNYTWNCERIKKLFENWMSTLISTHLPSIFISFVSFSGVVLLPSSGFILKRYKIATAKTIMTINNRCLTFTGIKSSHLVTMLKTRILKLQLLKSKLKRALTFPQLFFGYSRKV